MRARFLLVVISVAVFFGLVSSSPFAFSFSEFPIRGLVNMVDFGAKTCIPCKMMEPILEELHKEYKDVVAIVFVDVSVRYQLDIARKYEIRALPTQIFFDENGKEVYRHEGFMDKQSIVKQLNAMGVRKQAKK